MSVDSFFPFFSFVKISLFCVQKGEGVVEHPIFFITFVVDLTTIDQLYV